MQEWATGLSFIVSAIPVSADSIEHSSVSVVGHGSQQSMATKSFEAGGLDEVINLLDAPSGMTDPSAETNIVSVTYTASDI